MAMAKTNMMFTKVYSNIQKFGRELVLLFIYFYNHIDYYCIHRLFGIDLLLTF